MLLEAQVRRVPVTGRYGRRVHTSQRQGCVTPCCQGRRRAGAGCDYLSAAVTPPHLRAANTLANTRPLQPYRRLFFQPSSVLVEAC